MYNRETDYRNKKNLELYFDFYKWKPKLLVKFLKNILRNILPIIGIELIR